MLKGPGMMGQKLVPKYRSFQTIEVRESIKTSFERETTRWSGSLHK